jgi:hypothetical protein
VAANRKHKGFHLIELLVVERDHCDFRPGFAFCRPIGKAKPTAARGSCTTNLIADCPGVQICGLTEAGCYQAFPWKQQAGQDGNYMGARET